MSIYCPSGQELLKQFHYSVVRHLVIRDKFPGSPDTERAFPETAPAISREAEPESALVTSSEPEVPSAASSTDTSSEPQVEPATPADNESENTPTTSEGQ